MLSTVEDTLCSKVRLKILGLLVESQNLTTSDIAAKIGCNYVMTRKHLEALESAEVLAHINFGRRIRYYRFKESAKANAVRNLMAAWHCPERL